METIVIVIHLMIVLALVGVVLLQRSEGGGLGIGGGSGFMTARGAANALTRATAILAAAFLHTSLGLSLLARYSDRPTDILDRAPATQGEGTGVLDKLGGGCIGRTGTGAGRTSECACRRCACFRPTPAENPPLPHPRRAELRQPRRRQRRGRRTPAAPAAPQVPNQ